MIIYIYIYQTVARTGIIPIVLIGAACIGSAVATSNELNMMLFNCTFPNQFLNWF